MLMDAPLESTALFHAIQLALVPAFLLTAIGGVLGSMTVRLGRIVDRARALEEDLPENPQLRGLVIAELETLDRRMALTNRAVSLVVTSGLTLCLLIAALFLSSLSVDISAHIVVPVLFIIVMLLLIVGLSSFLMEIRISLRTVRVRAELVAGACRPAGRDR